MLYTTWTMRPPTSATQALGRLSTMLAPGATLYRDAHYLVADVEVDPAAARRWVPWPLRPSVPTTASVFTAYFPHTSFGSVYREAGLFLHVEHRGVRAVHCPWMIVDDDVALIAGRELLGYPKKLGEIDFAVDGDRVVGVARRRGVELLRMEGTLGAPVVAPPPMLGRPHRNLRGPIGSLFPRVVAFTPTEVHREARPVALDLRVGGSDRDPLSDLGVGAVRAAFLHRVDLGTSGVPRSVGLTSPLHALRSLFLRAH